MTTPISTRKSAKYRNFTQINKDSTTQDGAEFTLLVDRLFLGTGGHLVLSHGCEIMALFDEIKLNSLELTLFVDEDACRKLYRAFDIEMNISRTTDVRPNRLFRAVLTLSADKLLRYAKQTPPAGAPVDRLIELLRSSPNLTQKLNDWELKGAFPMNQERISA
jgi:hypothetical protein